MRGLRGLLIRNIAITGIFWCFPLLAFTSAWFVALGMAAPEPLMFARLLGAAYLALLVGYYMGLKSSLTLGEFSFSIVDTFYCPTRFTQSLFRGSYEVGLSQNA